MTCSGINALSHRKRSPRLPNPFQLRQACDFLVLHPLKDELRKRIAWALSQPQSESTYFESPLRCFVGRVPLVNSPEIPMMTNSGSGNRFIFDVNLHNSVEQSIGPVEFQCGILCPECFEYIRATGTSTSDRFPGKAFSQGDGRVLHIIDQAITLLPGAWERLNVVLLTGRRNSPSIPQPLPLAVRLFTLAGPLDFPFTVAFWEGGASQQNLGCAFGTRAGPGFPSASRLTSARLLQGPEW